MKMKTIIAAALLALGTFAASAQQYTGTTIAVTNGSSAGFDGTTNLCVVAATTTNTCNSVLTLTKTGDVGIQLTTKLSGSGTSAVTASFDTSFDGTNWTTGNYTIIATAAGATTVTVTTNLTIGTVGYLRLASLGNANANGSTNTVRYWTKPSRFSQ